MSKKFIFVDANGDYEESVLAYETADFVASSAGAGDAAKPIVLDAGGKLDASLIDDSDIDHDSIANNGTNSHATIDSHLGDATIHFTEASIDHGSIGGLGDDDHTQYTLANGTRAFSGDVAMGSNKITGLANGSASGDAVNFSQLQSAQSAFDLKDPVRVATIEPLPAYTQAGSGVGATLTANAVGVLTIDGVATALGDRILIKNENGNQDSEGAHVDHGIYEVTTAGAAGAAFVLTRAPDADGTPTGEVTQGLMTIVLEGTVNANYSWLITTDNAITVDTTTLTFGKGFSSTSYTASLGAEIVGSDIRADLLSGGGIKLTGNEIGVEPNDFAGAGLIDDGSDNLAIDWSTTFNDAKAVKASDLASTATGKGASIVGIFDTDGYYTGTDVETALKEIGTTLSGGVGGVDYTVGTGGVTAGDLVYVSANNTVLPYDTITAPQAVIGVAATTEAAAGTVKVLANDTVLAGVLTGATAGTKYYWDGANGWTSNFGAFGTSEYVWLGGVAKNATDVHVDVMFIRKTSAS